MDKDLISIDDLVRQRLGGGEEQERSGAWLQMRDLLDKEMPQEKRAGFIYWRRMMGAVGVLLLIASIAVGGYELNASRNGSAANTTTDVALPAASAHTTITATKNEVSDAQISSQGVADNNEPKKPSAKKLLAANDNQHKNGQNHIAAANTTAPAATNNTEVTNTKTAHAVAANTDKSSNVPVTKTTAAKTAESNGPGEKAVKEEATTTPAQNIAKAAPAHTTKSAPATQTKEVAAADTKASTAPVNKTTVTSEVKVGKTEEHKAATTGDVKVATAAANTKVAKTAAHKNVTKQATAPKTTGNDVAAINKVVNDKATAPKPTATKTKAAKTEKMEALALSSAVTSASSPKIGKVNKVKAPTAPVTTTGVVAAGSSVAGINKKATAKAATAGKVAAPKATAKNEPAKNEKVAAKTTASAATPTTVTSTNNNTVAANIPVAAAPVAAKTVSPADMAAMKAAYALNTKKGKKIIQKLVLYEHHIKTDPSDDQHNLDTISIETLTQELGENSPYLPCPIQYAARQTPGNNTPGSNNGSGNEVASATSAGNAQILPGASASAIGKPAMGANTASKQSAGASALENLNSAFNDIKYKVKGVQFAPGLTAGINGTFFGPSSFKGFEFGLTGDFIFGNDWSFVTELKYFHRINNSYTLNDDYSHYTDNGNGTWTKQQISNSYAFSTIHSLEMPLIVRYTAGKFNFFVGGNIVYSFSINEGETIPQPNGNATVVPAKGNDETAKLNASDFNSRFGFGCIFGVSYKVAPNVTLDIRNVQTVWDNANSAGSKYISDQVYKSPSLQLSLGYRLGGHKQKD